MERIELEGLTVVDDSYNSNPESVRAAVRVLAGMHGYRRRVLVLGDMLELGDLAAELHHHLGLEAAQSRIDVLVLVGELSKATAAGALEGGLPRGSVHHFSSTTAAVAAIRGLVETDDIVLVKGSRRMALESIVEELVTEEEQE
jgi:UDP-N-acetylmuramoyl-tripeptide--D-alanyl-D-alanine ligase